MFFSTHAKSAFKNNHWHLFSIALLIILAAGIYYPTFSFHFLANWDDPLYVTQNSSIQEFTLNNLILQFKTTYGGNYAPLQMISYMVDHALWGMNPGSYHFTNLLFHALNGLLCYLLIWRLAGNRLAALIAGVLFIVHPVQVESVAWISQRKTVLSTFFFLASLLWYHRFRTSGKHPAGNYLVSILLFAFALLAKSVAVVLPLVLLAYEYSFNKDKNHRCWKNILIGIIPFLLIAALSAVAAILTQSPEYEGGRTGYHGGSAYATFLTMLPVFVSYLMVLVWPANLSALYFPSVKTGIDAEVIAALLFLIALGAFSFHLLRKRPSLLFWFTLFIVGLIPVAQIVPLVTIMNDRYLYLPMSGFAGCVGLFASYLEEKSSLSNKAIITIPFICIVIALSVAAHRRTAVWHDSVSLWLDTSQKIPDNKDILSVLAESYHISGDADSALTVYQKVFSLESHFAESRQEQNALNTYSLILMARGEFKNAEKYLTMLTMKFPNNTEGFVNLGDCFRFEGDKVRSEMAYAQALQLKPLHPRALLGMGNLELEKGNSKNADRILNGLLSSGVDGPDLRVAMARLAVREGKNEVALDHLEQALRLGLVNPSRLTLVPEFAILAQVPRFIEITRNVALSPFPEAKR